MIPFTSETHLFIFSRVNLNVKEPYSVRSSVSQSVTFHPLDVVRPSDSFQMNKANTYKSRARLTDKE